MFTFLNNYIFLCWLFRIWTPAHWRRQKRTSCWEKNEKQLNNLKHLINWIKLREWERGREKFLSFIMSDTFLPLLSIAPFLNCKQFFIFDAFYIVHQCFLCYFWILIIVWGRRRLSKNVNCLLSIINIFGHQFFYASLQPANRSNNKKISTWDILIVQIIYYIEYSVSPWAICNRNMWIRSHNQKIEKKEWFLYEFLSGRPRKQRRFKRIK